MCIRDRRLGTPSTSCPKSRLTVRGRCDRYVSAGTLAGLARISLAQARIAARTVGREQVFADFGRPDGGFVDGKVYVFCNPAEGVVLANGGNPKLVGRNPAAVRDTLGHRPIAEVDRIALTQGRGWHDYVWPNPATGMVQRKKTYVVRIDDHTVCGSGYYQPGPP